MLESASGEQDGKVRIIVCIGISHVASVKHHDLVQKTRSELLFQGHACQQVPEQAHLPVIDFFKLSDLFFHLTMMT